MLTERRYFVLNKSHVTPTFISSAFARRDEVSQRTADVGGQGHAQDRRDTHRHAIVPAGFDGQNVVAVDCLTNSCERNTQCALTSLVSGRETDKSVSDANSSSVQAEVMRICLEEPIKEDIVNITDDVHRGTRWIAVPKRGP